jgi:hypothetical protein
MLEIWHNMSDIGNLASMATNRKKNINKKLKQRRNPKNRNKRGDW